MVKRASSKNKLGYFSKTIFFANIIAAISLLLSYAASFINPQDFWIIAFFGLGYLPILLINIGFIIYWLLRKKRFALLSILTILIGWNLLNTHINFQNNKEKIVVKADTNIRVMSFNVHLFKKYNNPKDNFREETIELMKSVNADVICFQEFYSRLKGKKKFVETVKSKGEFEEYYFEPIAKNELEGYGPAIFSKYPIIDRGSLYKNGYGINRIIYVDIKRESDTIRVYNVHLRSFALQEEDRNFVQQNINNVGSLNDEKGTKRVGKKLKNAFTNRSEQAKSLRNHIENCPYTYIVMGDFNDTPMSYSVNLISKGMNNAFEEKGFGWGVTHFGLLPIFQIDYILCDTKIHIDDFGIIKEKLSDHYPIWADLTL